MDWCEPKEKLKHSVFLAIIQSHTLVCGLDCFHTNVLDCIHTHTRTYVHTQLWHDVVD